MAIFNKILCKKPGCNYWRTAPVLEKKIPNDKQIEIHGCPQCGGEVYTSTKFTIQYYEKGGGKRTRTFDTMDEAKAVLATVERDKLTKKLFPQLKIVDPQHAEKKPEGPDGSTPFDQIATECHETRKKSIQDVGRDETIIRHLISFFGNKPIKDILPRDIYGYMNHRYTQTVIEARVDKKKILWKRKPKKVGKGTVRRELNILKVVLKHAESNKYIRYESEKEQPFYEFPMPKGRTVKPKWKLHELEKLFEALPTELAKYFRFIGEVGCRKGEAMTLKWTMLDLENKMAYLCDTKAAQEEEEEEVLFLTDEAVRLIKAQEKVCEYVFYNPKTKTRWVSPNKVFRKKAIELEMVDEKGRPIRPHDLRHIVLTALGGADVNQSTIMKISRHKDARSVQRYIHPDQESVGNAFSKIGK